MTTPKPDKHVFAIECCDQVRFVERTLELALHVERRLGAIMPLVGKLQQVQLSVADLAAVYHALLSHDPDTPPPGKSEIAAWLFQTGTRGPSLALGTDLLLLIAGEEALEAWHHQLERSASDARAAALALQAAGAASRPAAGNGAMVPDSTQAAARGGDAAAAAQPVNGEAHPPKQQPPPPANDAVRARDAAQPGEPTPTEQRRVGGAWVPRRARQPAQE